LLFGVLLEDQILWFLRKLCLGLDWGVSRSWFVLVFDPVDARICRATKGAFLVTDICRHGEIRTSLGDIDAYSFRF
jgi:hypothetical protein